MATEEPDPLYQQVADDIRAKITSGTYPVKGRIPSTPQLGEEYGVSKTVVRQAVDQLRADGILTGQPGKGVYVKAMPAQVEEERRDLKAIREEIAELSRRAQGYEELRADLTRVEDNLMNLYAKLAHDYPHEETQPSSRKAATP